MALIAKLSFGAHTFARTNLEPAGAEDSQRRRHLLRQPPEDSEKKKSKKKRKSRRKPASVEKSRRGALSQVSRARRLVVRLPVRVPAD